MPGLDKRTSPRQGIGVQNERSLHNAIKDWLALPGDQFEVKVGKFIVDIVRDDLLIEVQTRNFSAIRAKLRNLAREHRVRLVYPLAKEKWITRVDRSGRHVLGKRKSPRRADLCDLFDELVAIPDLIEHENFELSVLLIREEEIRADDGQGSWWRRRQSIRDRKLIEVIETVSFRDRQDFGRFLPDSLEQPFSNKMLAAALAVGVDRARRVTYCLKKMGLIVEAGKNRNELLYQISNNSHV